MQYLHLKYSEVPQHCMKIQYLSKCTYFPPLAQGCIYAQTKLNTFYCSIIISDTGVNMILINMYQSFTSIYVIWWQSHARSQRQSSLFQSIFLFACFVYVFIMMTIFFTNLGGKNTSTFLSHFLPVFNFVIVLRDVFSGVGSHRLSLIH